MCSLIMEDTTKIRAIQVGLELVKKKVFVDLGDATNRETTRVGLEFVGTQNRV